VIARPGVALAVVIGLGITGCNRTERRPAQPAPTVTRAAPTMTRAARGTVPVVIRRAVRRPTTSTARPAPPLSQRVVLIGDSVMAAMSPDVTDAARRVLGAAGWDVMIDAAESRSTLAGVDVVRQLRPQITDTAVIMLGHNDSSSGFRHRAAAVMQALSGVRHVYWLTMKLPRYRVADAALVDLTNAFSNLHLVDWARRAQPAWTAGDGLHLSTAGAVEMAKLILATIGSRRR
jgi:lysophospholipase L1-like esterase